MRPILGVRLVVCLVPFVAHAFAVEVAPLVKTICAVDTHGKGHREAIAAWKELSKADASQLTEILSGMRDADLLAQNWIRAAAETVADRQIKSGDKLPVSALEQFLADSRQSPRARRLAYELIAKVDDKAESRLIPALVNDASLELRRDALSLLLKEAAAIDLQSRKSDAVKAYRRIFDAARDVDQIELASEKLLELGEKVDLPRHYGFVLSWKLIGPFDNTDKKGFDIAYPPEKEIDLSATYPGKGDMQVRWLDHTTVDESGMGIVDLNKAIGKHMGVIGYAYAEFIGERERDVELRLGCINGNKIWLNGQLLTANHVYHTGQTVDQYVAKGRLVAGRNTILLKIAQNEQKEDWAQNWQFQLRVCDSIGTAILSRDRPADTSVTKTKKTDKKG
jgi:hypothetical protein